MMRRGAVILALLSLFVLLVSVEARPLARESVRELVLHAETIVLAEPIEQRTAPTRFKVLEVLRGDAVKAGDTFTLDAELRDPQKKRNPPMVEQALLFLGPNRSTREQPRFEPIASGLYFRTRDGSLLVPVPIGKRGSYVLEERRDIDWSALVQQTRADSDEINDLFARKRLQPTGRRNRALLEWVERHRHEFGAPTATPHPDKAAQGYLEARVFQWVLDSGEPTDCWSAVKLYAELNRGAVPPLHEPAFGTRAGRALLLRIATANDVLEGDRIRALTLLSHPFTLWSGAIQRLPKVQLLGAKEQTDLLDRLIPLLTSPSAPLRAAAAHTIRCASHPEILSDEHPESQRALPALLKAYRAEPPGDARHELAEAVCVLGGAKHWQELTGNPFGMVVCLRDLERQNQQVHFWLSLRPRGQLVYECPTLLLEQLDKANKVVEKKSMPLPEVNLPKPWNDGWDGVPFLLVQFSVKDFKDGSWRVRVEGTAGKDKRKWTAEPKTFVIEPPRKQKDGPSPFAISDW